jgi:hypothetical protein
MGYLGQRGSTFYHRTDDTVSGGDSVARSSSRLKRVVVAIDSCGGFANSA